MSADILKCSLGEQYNLQVRTLAVENSTEWLSYYLLNSHMLQHTQVIYNISLQWATLTIHTSYYLDKFLERELLLFLRLWHLFPKSKEERIQLKRMPKILKNTSQGSYLKQRNLSLRMLEPLWTTGGQSLWGGTWWLTRVFLWCWQLGHSHTGKRCYGGQIHRFKVLIISSEYLSP